MSREEFTQQLPDIVYHELGIKPPLIFRNVSARFFPLRASLDMLQQLCDGVLNIVPPEAGYFRAPLPYVYMVVLNYGQMGEEVMRTGWFSQVEVYFGVVVEWYKRVHGKWEFHDWGVITPYIFVNDDVSVPVGRAVYGYTKILSQVEKAESSWLKNPVARTNIASIATKVFPQVYKGGNLELRVFLEVERASISTLRVPFEGASPLMPWTIAMHLADATTGFQRDALRMAQSMRIAPINPGIDPAFGLGMLGRVPHWFAPGGAGFVVNSLNLKQFRRAEKPGEICYQSLTNGRLRTTAFNRSGLLGENRILVGDLSGGHSIRLHEHSSLPIARTLGLEVHRSWEEDGIEVAELKPVMPFWMDLNLRLESGTNVAWRTDEGIWRDESGERFPAPREAAPPFNDEVTNAIQAITGPFRFMDTTLHIIRLPACKRQLRGFLNRYINKALKDPIVDPDGKPERVRFTLRNDTDEDAGTDEDQCEKPGEDDKPDSVYLVVTSYGNVISETNNVGQWAHYELAFLIPVAWRRQVEPKKWEWLGDGLIPAFTFADNSIMAMSRFEIQGVPEDTAKFDRPENIWLIEGEMRSCGDLEEMLLKVDAELLPALGTGQEGTFLPVIKIIRSASDKDSNGDQLAAELKGAKDGDKTSDPFDLYTLKQIRDVCDPDKACYQSVVRVPREICGEHLLPSEFDVNVKIYEYPALRIVSELGIQTDLLKEKTAGIGHQISAIPTTSIRGTVTEAVAERLLSRAGTKQWTIYPDQAFKKRESLPVL